MIKLITFNILCSDNRGGPDYTIAARAPRVKKTIEPYDPDIIGFQEATEPWMPYLEEFYGEEYEIFNHWRKENNHESTPILWKKDRFECLDKGWFWFSDTPSIEFSEPWDHKFGCNRICLWVKLWDKKEGVSFTFFNTHYGFGDAEQIKSSTLLLNYMKAIGGPCFATADFNMGAGSPGYKKLTERLVDVNVATVNDPRSTFNALKADDLPYKPGDLCFITPENIEPVTSKLLHEKIDGKYASDHFAVYFELNVQKAVKLISMNVWCGGGEKEAVMVRRFLRAEAPDIVGLQEVTPVFEEELRKLKNYEIALRYRGEQSHESTPVLWNTDRFDLVQEEHFWLSDTPDREGKCWGGSYLRIASVVVLQFKGIDQKICVLSTHFDFTAEHHLNSVKLIAEKLKPYADLPILICGDFNMTPGSAGYQAMTEQFRDVRWMLAPTDNTPTTNNHGKCVSNAIIDYVFTNEHIEPKSYQVVSNRTKDGYRSDHEALRTTYIVK